MPTSRQRRGIRRSRRCNQKEKCVDDLFQQLFQCAKRFDQAVDLTLPCLLGEEDQKISFRHWAAGKLQEKLFGVAKSLSKLIKVSAEVELNEINAHSQSILALSRVLTELCNKLAYLALDPKDDNELRLRTLYFSLVGAVRYKEKLETISDPSGNLAAHQEQLKKISEKIDDRKSRLQEAGFEDWEAFKRENPKIQTLLREGRTAED